MFQANSFKRVNYLFRITRTGFTVLAAGYTIEKQKILRQFITSQLTKTFVGISQIFVFIRLKRPLRREFIVVKSNTKNLLTYRRTDRGKACINSFVQHFRLTISIYKDDLAHGRPGFYRCGQAGLWGK